MSVFRSAITGNDGTVDPGYLALFWTMAVTVSSIPWVVGIGGWIAVFRASSSEVGSILQNMGIAVGSICTGTAVVIGAVGAFRMGDKARGPQPAATTNTVSVEMNK